MAKANPTRSINDTLDAILEAESLDVLEEIRRALTVEICELNRWKWDLAYGFMEGGPHVKKGPRRGRRMSEPWRYRRMRELLDAAMKLTLLVDVHRCVYVRARQLGATPTLNGPIVADSA